MGSSRAVGLADRLGYQHDDPNAAQRWMRRYASSRFGAWTFAKTLHHIDRLVARVRPGHTLPEYLAGLPMLWVTTTGARTGLPRTLPLLGIPAGDAIALVGTSFGQSKTPAWYHNLRAHPEATVRFHDQVVAVRAREVEAGERERIMDAAHAVYVGYAAYERRINGRAVHVMVLDAA
jgi:deazaflavin-dependent oxidoreductase (nitroreductase family)